MRWNLWLLGFLIACIPTRSTPAAPNSAVVVFWEDGFPAADTANPNREAFDSLVPGATFAAVAQLGEALARTETRLLVLPFGSAFPEEQWETIHSFLVRGGNLLVLGGKPFTRAAYRDRAQWRLRGYSVRFTRQVMIDQYEETPGSDGLDFEVNSDLPLKLPRFAWKRGFSPVIRLSTVDLYRRGGAAGSIDARVDALAWGSREGRKLSAPALVVDHIRNGFGGGRWVFLNAELPANFFEGATGRELIRDLSELATNGSHEFTVRPVLPLYLPGEPVQLEVTWYSAAAAEAALQLRIVTYPENQPSSRSETSRTVPLAQPIILPAPTGKGMYRIDAELLEGGKTRALYHSGFWIRDDSYLRSGPRLNANHDYFELDGIPLAVVGTTYMSSEVQRLYFEHPNVYVWDRDLTQIRAAGLNMIRTGWWTGWEKFCDENGQPYERTLRTLEAYLMTARKNRLPVQFNFFAFLPEVLGGANPYLDPEAVRRQQMLVSSVVARFHDVPYLAWDLINEPSFSERLWTMRPNGDAIELARWNQWLSERYSDPASLADAWNLPVSSTNGNEPLPEEHEFAPRGMYAGYNSLKLYDYFLFAQESFAGWVRAMRDVIRGTGSKQLVTVGQDEGGFQDRLSPAFFGPFVDFTTNHSWWQNDYLLWDSLVAKQPGIAMLLQETGLQRELNLDEVARRTPESEAALLERKIAMSFVGGSGAIEWLWNTNSYMTNGNETPIGAVRPDGTEKQEAGLLRDFSGFAKLLQAHLQKPQPPSVAIITSQAAQFSAIADLQLEAQRKAIRALAYYDHITPYVIAENRIGKLGSPNLAILPSPQCLTETAWRSLLTYVNGGGNLLLTGPVDRDEHWQIRLRAADLNLDARAEPLVYHNALLQWDGRAVPLSFDQQKQAWLDSVRFKEGSTLRVISRGKGQVFWAAYPVELGEGLQASADLYAWVLERLSIGPMFELQSTLSPGVLVSAIALDDSVLYVMVSDSADDATIDLRDKLTGVRLKLQLPAQHAALALIGRMEKSIIAKYGFK